MPNPCFCGCSLKKATEIIAIVETALYGFSFAVVLIAGVVLIFGGKVETEELQVVLAGNESKGWNLATVMVMLIICAGKFYLGIMLKRGSDQEDNRSCQIWLIVSAILFVLGIFSLPFAPTTFEVMCGILGMIYEGFALWVVYEFMKIAIERNRSRRNLGRLLFGNEKTRFVRI